jgi:hypothetical protein
MKKDSNKYKRLLLHSCCGPCSTSVLEQLLEEFDVSVFFYNPNIFPEEEYRQRLKSQRDYCERKCVQIIEDPYDHESWLKMVKGMENEPEGGKRCHVCFEMRRRETAIRAKSGLYDVFTSTLSVSPHKNYEQISEIGRSLAREHNLIFLDRDFKKRNGFKRSIEISKEFYLYRQNYCGCEFSSNHISKYKANS